MVNHLESMNKCLSKLFEKEELGSDCCAYIDKNILKFIDYYSKIPGEEQLKAIFEDFKKHIEENYSQTSNVVTTTSNVCSTISETSDNIRESYCYQSRTDLQSDAQIASTDEMLNISTKQKKHEGSLI